MSIALTHSSSIVIILAFQIITGGILPIATMILRLIPLTSDYGDNILIKLRYASPSFCLSNALIYEGSKKKIEYFRPDLP